jgi:plastocyanin
MTRSTGIAVVIILTVLIVGTAGALWISRRDASPAEDTDTQPTEMTEQNQPGNGVSTDGSGSTTTTSKPAADRPADNNDESPVDRETDTVQVSYTDEGFAPATTGPIQVGDAVLFTNKSSEKMWVASDDHPTHSRYPGFDQGRGVESGGTYKFTFTKAGSWGYHNHLNPSHSGTVQVIAE